MEEMSSIIEGFNRDDLRDINNAVYLGEKILEADFGLEFRDSSIYGVVSYELNVFACLNNIWPNNGNGEAYKVGKRLSKYNSKDLAQAAKFIFSGEAQIYPYDINKAERLSKEILSP